MLLKDNFDCLKKYILFAIYKIYIIYYSNTFISFIRMLSDNPITTIEAEAFRLNHKQLKL